jgi:hypothetical protein
MISTTVLLLHIVGTVILASPPSAFENLATKNKSQRQLMKIGNQVLNIGIKS